MFTRLFPQRSFLLLIAVCTTQLLSAQNPCAAQRLQLENLLNQLRTLEGLAPMSGAGTSGSLPKLMGPNSNVPPAVDESAIAAWHKAHDAEVKQLQATLSTKACALPAQPPPPYDLLYSEVDDNNAPLDPYWRSTVTSPFFSAPDPSQCGNGNPWQPFCTSQTTEINNNKGLCPTGELGGHANWIPATYVGRLTWESHSLESQDDDYNFGLLPLIPQSPTPWITAADDPVAGLHLEFSSDETIDHFKTPWWKSFHSAVDSDDSRSIDNPFGNPRREMVSGTSHALAMIQGNYAIVTGLVGLDCAHSCGAEIHPVWAIAIHVKDDPNDDVWAFFGRNWGNEGYCGSKIEEVNTTGFIFRLPWRPGATEVAVAGQNFEWPKNKTAGGTIDFRPDENAVLVSFQLSAPNQKDWFDGELHLSWKGSAQKSFLPAVAAKQLVSRKTEPEDDAEVSAAIAFNKLTPQQRAAVLQSTPKSEAAVDTQSVALQRSHIAALAAKIPSVTSEPDNIGADRIVQRKKAITAAKSQMH